MAEPIWQNDEAVQDSHNLLKFVISDRLYFDSNQNKWVFPIDNWDFKRDNEGNLEGISTDNKEKILAEYPAANSIEEAIQNYFSKFLKGSGITYLSKRCFIRINVAKIRACNLNVSTTPLSNRPHHCDIWPTNGHNDYQNNQKEILHQSWEWEILRKTDQDIP